MSNQDRFSSGVATGGGSDRAFDSPLSREGSRESDAYGDDFDPTVSQSTMVGCHAGRFLVFNLGDPEPGFQYSWERDTQSDDIAARLNGGEPVTDGMPEWAAIQRKVGAPSQPDSLVRAHGLVLYRYPESKVRERREREAAESLAQLRGVEAQFASGANEQERAAAGGRPTRVKRRDHRTEVRDGYSDSSRTLSHWTPDRGIIDEA